MNIDSFKALLIYHRHQGFFPLNSDRYNIDHQVTGKCKYSVTTRRMNRYPNSGFISKAEGMLRFNVFKEIPLADLEWPECGIKHKPVSLVLEPSQFQQNTDLAQTAEL